MGLSPALDLILRASPVFTPHSLPGLALWLDAGPLVPVTTLSDSFTRANNPSSLGSADTGQAWTTLLGTAGIIGNQAYFPSVTGDGGGGSYVSATVNAPGATTTVQVTFVNSTGARLHLRQSDSQHFFSLLNNGGVYSLFRIGLTTGQVGTGGVAANGDVLTVQLTDAQIAVSCNGTPIFTVTDTFNQTVTSHGIGASNTAARFAAFSVVTTSQGATGAAWPDVSGQGNTVTQATTSADPIPVVQTDGTPAVRFPPRTAFTGRWYTLPAGLSLDRQSQTIVLVARFLGLGGGSVMLIDPGTTLSDTFLANMNGQLDVLATNQGGAKQSTLRVPASKSFFALTSTATGQTVYLDEQSATLSAAASGTGSGGRLFDSQSGGLAFQGDVNAVLVYNRALSAGEIARLRAWAQRTYKALAVVPTRQVMCDGDSITFGFVVIDCQTYVWRMGDSLGPDWRVYNFGIPSETLATMLTNAVAKVDSLYNAGLARNVVVCWGGTNDLKAGTAVATVESNYQSYCAGRQAAGFKVVAATILPRSDGGTPAGFESDRLAFNTWLRANRATFADALADVGGDATMGTAANTTNVTYFADKVHPTSAGYALLASYFTAAVQGV